jgi:hypothetical protein
LKCASHCTSASNDSSTLEMRKSTFGTPEGCSEGLASFPLLIARSCPSCRIPTFNSAAPSVASGNRTDQLRFSSCPFSRNDLTALWMRPLREPPNGRCSPPATRIPPPAQRFRFGVGIMGRRRVGNAFGQIRMPDFFVTFNVLKVYKANHISDSLGASQCTAEA